MAGILWADAPYGIFTFVLLTLVLGGLARWATGRAMAQTWRPCGDACALHGLSRRRRAVPSLCALRRAVAVADSLYNAASSCMAVGVLGYRAMRATQMATQYSWAYDRSGLNWRAKGGG